MNPEARQRRRDVVRIVTIGVYGYDAASFRTALEQANVDIFVDTRRRRGVRGPQYAFANSQRLQGLLAGLGIGYVHRLDLAPSNETRRIQEQADHAAGILRRDRDCLAPAYIEAYRRDVLHSLDSRALVASLGNPESLLIFCVERTPDACHRSLLAAKLADDLDAPVEHIVP